VKAKKDCLVYASRAFKHDNEAEERKGNHPNKSEIESEVDEEIESKVDVEIESEVDEEIESEVEDEDDIQTAQLGAVVEEFLARTHMTNLSSAQLVISDEYEFVRLVCTVNKNGEPQYQLMPAVMDVLLRTLQNLDKMPKWMMDDVQELTFLLRSDGMNKQKNLVVRVMQGLAELCPELLSNVEPNREEGWTRATCSLPSGKAVSIKFLVCLPIFFLEIM
tara:strand:- start:58 stop:717 length:660 start_codon:yes stop_codon:yes gene_type:complete